MEVFLAKVLGLYLLIVGVIVLARRVSIMPAVADLAYNRALVLALAAIEMVAGLSLVVAYPVVEISLAGLLSLIGYIMVLESIIYFAFPAKAMRRVVEIFNRPIWYVGGGILSVLIGAYLTAVAFGFWV